MGENSIVVDGLVNWSVGDTVVLTSSDYSLSHTETFTILAISPYGTSTNIALSSAVSFNHHGTIITVNGQSLDIRAEVADLLSLCFTTTLSLSLFKVI